MAFIARSFFLKEKKEYNLFLKKIQESRNRCHHETAKANITGELQQVVGPFEARKSHNQVTNSEISGGILKILQEFEKSTNSVEPLLSKVF